MSRDSLRKAVAIILIALVSVAVATWLCYADEIHLTWDPNTEPTVTHYKIYMGTQADMTTWTWEEIGNVAAPATDYIYDLPTTELRLFRVSACNDAGIESIRYNAGAFNCFGWTPPDTPHGAGIE